MMTKSRSTSANDAKRKDKAAKIPAAKKKAKTPKPAKNTNSIIQELLASSKSSPKPAGKKSTKTQPSAAATTTSSKNDLNKDNDDDNDPDLEFIDASDRMEIE